MHLCTFVAIKAKKLRVTVSILFFFACYCAFAQQHSLRTRWVRLKDTTAVSDPNTIDPASLQILAPKESQVKAVFDRKGNALRFAADSTSPDSILISYRVFPFHLAQRIYNRDLTLYDSSKYYVDPMNRAGGGRYYEQKEELFTTPGLNKTGTISRGVSFGNNQDLFVNSALNLQMEGRLSQDISILAAISDQNIPVQPEGNTQNLQQFDRVYIQLSGKGAVLTAGDVVLRNKESYFMRYLKNVQGGFAEVAYSPIKDSKAVTAVGAAVSKGKFNSMFVDPVEGLQGPYKLRGPNNERFIIVISGSEKVYLDGRLLTRGFNYDYIIDYNQAQITFTNSVLITRYSRIRVDFEFTDKNFSRTTLVGNHYQTYKNWSGFFNFYSEKDNPNTPITAQLAEEDIEVLKRIGDTVSKAFSAGAVLSPFSADKVLYRRVDTLGTSIYLYTPLDLGPSVPLYTMTFADLGDGNGSYIQATSVANGRVFEWRPTISGLKQGRYEPIRQLPVPNKKQLYNGGLSYNFNPNERVYAEYAMSENSQNLFSTIDSYDDAGQALKVGYATKEKNLGLPDDYKLVGSLDYEFLDKHFRPIDRFRSIEFDRDWGITQYSSWNQTLQTTADDHVINATLGVVKNNQNQFTNRYSRREKEGFVNGYQYQANLAKRLGFYQVRSDFFLLRNDQPAFRSDWQRFSLDQSLVLKNLTPGYKYSLDQNAIRGGRNKDSVIASAMYFEEHKFYLLKNDSSRWRLSSDYSYRTDNAPINGEIANQLSTVAKTWNNNVGFKPNETNTLNLLFTYRDLENKRDTTSGRKNETIMGRIDWTTELLKRHVRSELTYVAQTGRQQVTEYLYILVPAGQGQYKWTDYNNNGIKELNEFIEAINYDEKIYVRYSSPTDRFVTAYTNNLNYRLNITSPRGWRGKGRIKDLISRLSNTTAWTADRKSLDPSLPSRFVPLYTNIAPTDVLSSINNFRSTFFFNRTSPSYGVDFIYINNQQKNFLFYGTDIRNTLEYQVNSRINVRSLFSLKLNLAQSTKGVASDYLTNRNYTIYRNEINPEISYQPTESFRLTGSFQYIPKKNTNELYNKGEKATFKNFGLEARLNQVSKRTVTASAKYINIEFVNGDINSPLGYDMLESLRPGNNFTWLATMQQKLTNGLNVSLNYEGRKPQDQAIVHIGRVQVSAVF